MALKIHYYMQFFPGPKSPGSQQPMALCRCLARRGHQVTVVSTDYNLDSGEKEESVCEEHRGGGCVRVLRLYSPRGGRGALLHRLWSYMHFMLTAKAVGFELERADLIIGSIQPLFTGWAAFQVARRKKSKYVLEVRDLWPDALVVKGAISETQAFPLHCIVNHLYRSADRIVCITPGIRTELLRKGLDDNKIDVFPNGFDPELFAMSSDAGESVRNAYGWGDGFLVIYAGSFTKVTAVEVVVRAAAALKNRPKTRFVLFGNGPTKSNVVALANELGLKNIAFYDPVPKREIPGLLTASDLALMCLFMSPLSHIYFENKFLDYMGAGKPVVAAMDGEQAEIIRRHETGMVVPPFDHTGLAGIIAQAEECYDRFAEMGRNGQRLVHERYLLPMILNRYADMLEIVAKGGGPTLATWRP